MTEIFDRIALVSDGCSRILVEQTADGFRLPRWEPSEIIYGHVVGPFNEALRRDLGLDVTSLRYLGRYQHATTGRHCLVYEMEWHNTGWRPPASFRWVSHEEWTGLGHVAEERPFLDEWYAEAESGVLPPQRAPWAIRGWRSGALAWFTEQARQLGRPLTGPVEQDRGWGISTVLRAPAGESFLYFKASGNLFREEPAITRALARLAPDRLPVVLAAEAGRAWMVMADFGGVPLKGTEEPAPWEEALREFARLQIASLDHEDRLLAAGVRDRRLPTLSSAFAALMEIDEALMPGHPSGLSGEQIEALRGLVPWVEDACDRLGRAGIPHTLVHGDLHSGNVAVTPRGPVFFDWSDAAWSHPFLDLVPFFSDGFEGPRADQRDRLRDAYLEPWSALDGSDGLHETFELAQTVGAAYQAVSYWLIVESLEPASRCELKNGIPHFLRLLLERHQATQR